MPMPSKPSNYDWCKTCGEFANLQTHNCPPGWYAWLEEDLENELSDIAPDDEDEIEAALRDVSRTVYSGTPNGAAEQFASVLSNEDPDNFKQFEAGDAVVCVRRLLDTTVVRFNVSGELVCQFYAHETQPAKRPDKG